MVIARYFVSPRIVLVLGVLGIGALASYLRADGTSRTPSAVAAPLWPEHRFLAIQKEWRKEVQYLQTDRMWEVGGALVVTPEEVGSAIKNCTREEIYYAAGEELPRKILQFHPSDYLQLEQGFLGKDQFSRWFYPSGTVKTYLYHRGARLLQGYDLSPGGRVSVWWLCDGEGEREMKDSGASGFRIRRWFHRGLQYLEKRYKCKDCVGIRLDVGSEGWDRLVVSPHSEDLHLKDKLWQYRRDLRSVWFQSKDKPLAISGWVDDPEREKEASQFTARRKEFLARYNKLLKDAGRNWEELGIDFIRSGGAWPK
ncbi:MAG TPA: hypothetical protein VH682_15100 [Gemmataceae bacterium]|jgi:hypothetical protein